MAEVKTDAELAEKREAARVAMEGPERTQKREREEKLEHLKNTITPLEKRLAEILKEKEELELNWIELDDRRKAIRQVLPPILDEEKKIEAEEASLETEEAKIGVPAEKHLLEEKRWQVQERRKAVEQKKWVEEEKLLKIEELINQNTNRYRALLDEEEKLQTELAQLKSEESLLEQ